MGKKKNYKKFVLEERQKMETLADTKYPQFYCTACKTRTWLYHIHKDGKENTSKTKDKVRGPQDTTPVYKN